VERYSELVRAAAARLRDRGHEVSELHAVAELSDAARRNLLLRCTARNDTGAPRNVIIKQVRGDYDPARLDSWDTRRFFRDWAGAELLTSLPGSPRGARFLAGDRELGFIVLEDLGEGQRSPLESLLARNAKRAVAELEQYVLALARMHGATLQHQGAYAAVIGQLQRRQPPAPLEYFGQHSAHELCAALPLSDDVAELLHAAVARVEEPGPFQALIHGDPCVDNSLFVGDELRFIDFEMARFGHALLDAVYVLAPFPTCSCAGRLPDSLACELLEQYRVALGQYASAANDVGAFQQAVLDACDAWLVYRLGWLLPEAQSGTREWRIGTTRARLLSALEQYALAARRYAGTPRLLDFAQRLLPDLRQRWPEATSLALFPAFA
jgi:thiamine kinase-like enzyme